MVQRSPSHFQTGTFYWAHVCVDFHTYISYSFLPFVSMRSFALLTKLLRSWVELIFVLEGDFSADMWSDYTN